MTNLPIALLTALALYTESDPELNKREVVAIASDIQHRAEAIAGLPWEQAVQSVLLEPSQFQGLENLPAEIPDDDRWNYCVKIAAYVIKRKVPHTGYNHFFSGPRPWFAEGETVAYHGKTGFLCL